ncbi:hypothetical protein NL676_022742 [Syzygium grande]|nr:hypothetical protein NL676_022742 [Syzygium grande]
MDARKEKLASLWQTAVTLALTFAVGALLPLLAAAFIKEYKVRLVVAIVAVSMALLRFGELSVVLGKVPSANDGLLLMASLMMGIGAVRKDVKTMVIIGVAGLTIEACNMAIEELQSMYS